MRFSTLCLSGLCSVVLFSCSPSATTGKGWSQLPSIAADNGYERGVSAPFIGTLDGRVIVAGGCNFPDVPAADGGSKRFYADIFALDKNFLGWESIGTLPQPLAYGASFTTPDGIVCAGGTDSTGRPVRDVFLITRDGTTPLAPLPEAADNCAGAYLEGKGYVVGNRSLYIYDCATKRWRSLAVPDNRRRLQAVCAAQAGKIWIFGGYDPAESSPYSLNYVYDPTTNDWETIYIPMSYNGSLLAAGATATTWEDRYITLFGGVNDSIFEAALLRGKALSADPDNDSLLNEQREYMEHEPAWYRFNDQIIVFDTVDTWVRLPEHYPQTARAGAAVVTTPDKTGIVLFNGEVKPGVRTPEVWLWRP